MYKKQTQARKGRRIIQQDRCKTDQLQFFSFCSEQYLCHHNEQNMQFPCIRGEHIFAHYHFSRELPAALQGAGRVCSSTDQLPPIVLQACVEQLELWCNCVQVYAKI